MISFTHLPHWVSLQDEMETAKAYGAPIYAEPQGLNANVVRRSAVAGKVIRDSLEFFPSTETLMVAHKAMFCESTPLMAGVFRDSIFTYPPTALRQEKKTCPPSEIKEKLEQLSLKATHAMGEGESKKTWMRGLAAWHAGFMEIHPFKDGNGRLARTVLNAQMEICFGPRKLQPLDPVEYKKALSDGIDGNWSPLAGIIGKLQERSQPIENSPSQSTSQSISI